MIKILAKSIREFKKASILTPLCMIMEVAMEILIPFLLSFLIDEGISNNDMQKIIFYGILLVIVAMLSLTFGVLSGKFAAKASSGFARNLREDVYNKVQDFSFFNIDKFSTSSLVTRLTSDVTNVQQAYMMMIKEAVRAPITIIFSIIMTFTISVKIGITYLIAAPLLGLVLIFIATKARSVFKRVFKKVDKLNNVVQENVRGIRVVKSFVTEDKEVEKFDNVSNELYEDFSKAERILAFNSPSMQFFINVCITILSWVGANLIISNNLTTGNLTSLFSYLMQCLNSLMLLSMVFVMITMAMESGNRIAEVLVEVPDLKNNDNPIYEVKNGKIEFKNVGFSYVKDSKKEVLKNINLSINSGETVGIIGSTGDR